MRSGITPHFVKCMKILVLTTGGTISSAYNGKSISLSDENSLYVIDKYKREFNKQVEFEIISPIKILSENISAHDFEMLYLSLISIEYENFDGVIITCGSDNLAYISSFVGLLFSDKNICVVATNKLLTEIGSNGFYNFIKAIDILKEQKNEVLVPWKNSDGNMYVYDSTTILPVDINGDVISFGKKQKLNFIVDSMPVLLSKVLLINLYPLMSYENFTLDNIKCVLHNTYHSGTASEEELLKFKEKCDKKNIKIYLCGIKENQKLYESTSNLINSGIIPLYDIAYPCAYIKLMLEYNS